MSHPLSDRTLALAGVFQAAVLVKSVARKGMVDLADLETSLYSIFQVDPPTVEAVYGEVQRLRTGLQAIVAQLGQDGEPKDNELTRYVVSLIHLQSRLRRNQQLLSDLRAGIERARALADQHSLSDDALIEALASLYTQTLSTLTPRIIVSGEPHILARATNAARIRAILLAGIRAAVLWQQCGGSRWQILFKRADLVRAANELLRTSEQLH
ncbi:MAG: hypothetical protein AMJ69_00080 [Gammaproteobacteria bacterium SG8_47]|nr:MAG: hypothetical protein AMJ69_00080 [Gammaproteobacteria bacterium SG8_47]